ncbi:MAG TPA: phosphodiester glycosidase family protein [Frankiaceae bacterium]|nr:phosphodiester glycosidase family protein [Frankiaceae bacterium]
MTLEKAADPVAEATSAAAPTSAAPAPPATAPRATPPSPPSPPASRRRFARFRRKRHPLIRVLQVLALVVLIFIGIVGYSVGGYLTRPGNDSVSQRVAEWGRDHHLGSLVTWLEQVQYSQNKPKKGGSIQGGIPKAAGDTAGPKKPVAPSIAHSKLPEPPVLLAGQGLPNEGKWQTVVLNKGLPAIQVAYVRPDAVHTSYYAALMWMDPKLLSGRLHEGIPGGDPGGTWSTPPQLTPELAKTVAAAFPGGFRTNNSAVGNRGGYYDDGREAEPLRAGAASLVIYKDGTATVGQWGRDAAMSPNVRSVRQNLDLLVDGGQVNQTCSTDSSPIWGYTIGNDAYVPRTAIGVRADGSLIFVNSPAVSVCSLGQLLKSAGVVRGMELDINYDWSIGYYFTHDGGQVQSHVSRSTQSKGPDHYFSPQSRDFVAFYLRP